MITIKRLAADDPEFARCFTIRWDVFVREQNVPAAEERDALDDAALHFLATDGGRALGTARVIMKPGGEVKITRVAVVKAARGQGIGAALIRAIEDELPLARGFVLDAQVTAARFYERLGYAARGEVFVEAGMDHRHMVKPMRAMSGALHLAETRPRAAP